MGSAQQWGAHSYLDPRTTLTVPLCIKVELVGCVSYKESKQQQDLKLPTQDTSKTGGVRFRQWLIPRRRKKTNTTPRHNSEHVSLHKLKGVCKLQDKPKEQVQRYACITLAKNSGPSPPFNRQLLHSPLFPAPVGPCLPFAKESIEVWISLLESPGRWTTCFLPQRDQRH